MSEPAALFVNTKSRRGQEWFSSAKDELQRQGVTLGVAQSVQRIEDLMACVRQAVGGQTPVVIVGGGDGTLSAVARLFVGSKSILGVLPLGTGNAFARDLGIVADLPRACSVIANGKVSGIDLGYAGHDYFVNVATIGLTTRIAMDIKREDKRRFGRLVYMVAVIRGLSSLEPFQVEIETENGRESFRTMQVVIGNGRYHAGPFPLAPDASISEGKLSLYALRSVRKSAFLRLALALPFGRQGDLNEVYAESCARGRLSSDVPLPVTVDGEVNLRTPFEFRVAPDAIRVMTPLEFSG